MDHEQETTEVRNTAARQGNTTVQRETVSRQASVDSRVVVIRVVWFIIGFIITLLALRVVLLALAANQDAGFVSFIYTVSGLFSAPFVGIFGNPVYGSSYFDTGSLLAIPVYALIGWGIQKLLTLTSANRDVR
jgi:hypothetical protein